MINHTFPSAEEGRPAEINRMLQIAKYGYILLSVMIGALGTAVIAVPELPMLKLCGLSGGLLIAFGWIKLLGYLSRDLYRLAFQYDLAFGILLNILGVLLILHNGSTVHLVEVVLGIVVLSDSLLKIQIAIDSRAFGLRYWWVILTAAVLTSVVCVGLLVSIHVEQETVMALLGASVLGEGILSLVTVLTAVKILQKKELCPPQPDRAEARRKDGE